MPPKHRVMLIATALLCGCNGDAVPTQTAPTATPATETQRPASGPERRILAFGDSLFAAHGLEKPQGYPARLQAALRGKGINATVVDAGVSGDTTAAGLQRLAFVLSNAAKPDLAIVELGGNDMLRGIPPAETRSNLNAILAELGKRGIPVLVMGMRAPPNMGAEFARQFDGIYPALAKDHKAALVPFFLAPTYDKPQLIQQDHIHPTAEGIDALVAATVAEVADALPPPAN
jgi:acyl-CoA thioesterase-1